MRRNVLLLAVFALCGCCMAQESGRFPLGGYDELADTKPHDGKEVWDRLPAAVQLGWGTTDVRYRKRDVPVGVKNARLDCGGLERRTGQCASCAVDE